MDRCRVGAVPKWVVVKIKGPFLGTLNNKNRDPKRGHNFDNHPNESPFKESRLVAPTTHRPLPDSAPGQSPKVLSPAVEAGKLETQ